MTRWEKDEGYCSIVRQIEPFKNDSTLLLDLIDTTVFDYLIGNADRHHYETVDGVEKGMLVMLDNGKRSVNLKSFFDLNFALGQKVDGVGR